MTEQEIRRVVVATAESFLGIREGSAEHHALIDIYNGRKPWPRGYKMPYDKDWCAVFVSAVGYSTGFSDIIFPECGAEEMVKLYQRAGRWLERDDYTPLPGDVILYDWQAKPGPAAGWSDHVGLVEKVEGRTITVIEGNKGDAVARRQIPVGWVYVRGYGLPDYASKATDAKPKPPAAWETEAMARAKARGLMDGTRPDDKPTRAELAVVANRLYDLIKERE